MKKTPPFSEGLTNATNETAGDQVSGRCVVRGPIRRKPALSVSLSQSRVCGLSRRRRWTNAFWHDDLNTGLRRDLVGRRIRIGLNVGRRQV